MTIETVKNIILKIYVSLYYIAYTLVSKVEGIFILSLVLYFFSCELGLGDPYSFTELILWVDNLSEGAKISIVSSLITILGFLIAFNIGAAHQKQQFVSQMKIEAVTDVEEFFNAASRNSTAAKLFAQYLLDITSHINNHADANTILFHMKNVMRDTEKHYAIRASLQQQAIEVHRLIGKYAIIFAHSWGAINKIETANGALEEIANKIWFKTPLLDPNDPNAPILFLEQIDTQECTSFIETYNVNYSKMNSYSGGLRGSMLAPITGMNFSLILNILKKG